MIALDQTPAELFMTRAFFGVVVCGIISVPVLATFVKTKSRWFFGLWISMAVAVMGLLSVDISHDNRVKDQGEASNVQGTLDALHGRYDLQGVTYRSDKGDVYWLGFEEADGDRCEGEVRDGRLYEVVCKKIYEPTEYEP